MVAPTSDMLLKTCICTYLHVVHSEFEVCWHECHDVVVAAGEENFQPSSHLQSRPFFPAHEEINKNTKKWRRNAQFHLTAITFYVQQQKII